MLVTINVFFFLCLIPMGLLKSMIVKSMVGKTSRLTFFQGMYICIYESQKQSTKMDQ